MLTGHDNGLITLNVAEADSAEREKMRAEMGENYRTLLGHFRHELGHYYWDRLVRDDPGRLERFHAVFGDESADYDAALTSHYAQGAPPDWETRHISAYAASHPWEDWAETFAHYLHITDTLEMVRALNMPLARLETDAGDELPDSDRASHLRARCSSRPAAGSRRRRPSTARWRAGWSSRRPRTRSIAAWACRISILSLSRRWRRKARFRP